MTLLASRQSYCLRSVGLLSGRDSSDACSRLVDNNSCEFYCNAALLVQEIQESNSCHGIEELLQKGRTVGGCPYFAASGLVEGADLVPCPCNYVLDKKLQKSKLCGIEGDIVIFDEAHNIDDICREAGSMKMTASSFDLAAKSVISLELSNKIGPLNSTLRSAYSSLKTLLQRMCLVVKAMGECVVGGMSHTDPVVIKGDRYLKILESEQINIETVHI